MNTERSIQIKLFVSYIILISASIFAIWYIMDLSKELEKPKEMALLENNRVFKVGNLISDIYLSETTSRVALLTLNENDIKRYNAKVDSLKMQTAELKANGSTADLAVQLDSLDMLLDMKRESFKQIVNTRIQFQKTSTYKNALQKMNTVAPTSDSIPSIATLPDNETKSTFMQRLSNVFTSKDDKEREEKELKRILESKKIQEENQKKIEEFKKNSQIILMEALNKENNKLKQYYQQEEKLLQKNIEFSNQIREIITSVENITNVNSRVIFDQTSNKITKVTRNLIFFGSITLLIILVLALILINDINKNYLYKKNLEISNKNLEEVIHQKNFFLAAITHDMNAPLNTLFGYTELLENSLKNQKLIDYVQNIQYSASYFKKLVEDLSMFSKLEHKFLELVHQDFNFKDVLTSIYQQQLSVSNKKEIDLICEIDPQLDNNFYSDPHRIQQILTNVISNAIKFTNKGYVKIVAKYCEEGIVIQIIDTGIGINIDKKEDLYKEFVQAHKDIIKTYGGTGLGLNITKRLIDQFKGSIDYESEMGKGTTFTITFPLHITEEKVKAEANLSNFDPTKKLSNKNILVIDDDQLQLNLLKEVLSDRVKSIDLLSNGKYIDEYLDKKQYHLIISDLQMPHLSGYDIISNIRKREAYKDIPVIAFSGKIDLNEKELKEIGFSAILRKPLHLRNLLVVVYDLLKIKFDNEAYVLQKNTIEPAEMNESDGYNLQELYTLLDNDQEAVKKIIEAFIENAMSDMYSIYDYYKDNNRQKISELAHKMLPMYRQLKIKELIDVLENLERNIDDYSESKLKREVFVLFIKSNKIFKQLKKIELS